MGKASDFHVGQRVRLTAAGMPGGRTLLGLQGRAKTNMGTVRRVDTDAVFRIFVQRDGLKGTDSYHCDFWEPVPGAPREGR